MTSHDRRSALKLSLGAMGLLTLPQLTQFARAAEDFIRGPRIKDHPIKQLSKHVWMIYSPDGFPTPENQGMMANITFVETAKGIVVIDTGASVQIGEMAIRMMKTFTKKPVIALFNSHYHGDHFLGNQAFVEAYGPMPIYAHPFSMKEIKQQPEPKSSLRRMLQIMAMYSNTVMSPSRFITMVLRTPLVIFAWKLLRTRSRMLAMWQWMIVLLTWMTVHMLAPSKHTKH